MKEKEKEKKQIRIPRLVVYIIALLTAIIVCVSMSFTFGVAYAAEFATVAIFNCVIAFVCYNIIDKWDEQPWRLTPKYWGLVALILMSDVLFILSAKASTKYWGCILSIGLLASVSWLFIPWRFTFLARDSFLQKSNRRSRMRWQDISTHIAERLRNSLPMDWLRS